MIFWQHSLFLLLKSRTEVLEVVLGNKVLASVYADTKLGRDTWVMGNWKTRNTVKLYSFFPISNDQLPQLNV